MARVWVLWLAGGKSTRTRKVFNYHKCATPITGKKYIGEYTLDIAEKIAKISRATLVGVVPSRTDEAFVLSSMISSRGGIVVEDKVALGNALAWVQVHKQIHFRDEDVVVSVNCDDYVDDDIVDGISEVIDRVREGYLDLGLVVSDEYFVYGKTGVFRRDNRLFVDRIGDDVTGEFLGLYVGLSAFRWGYAKKFIVFDSFVEEFTDMSVFRAMSSSGARVDIVYSSRWVDFGDARTLERWGVHGE